jgi:hypothetical protein
MGWWILVFYPKASQRRGLKLSVFDMSCTSIGYHFQRGYGLQWRNYVIFFDTRRFPWAVDLKNVIIS